MPIPSVDKALKLRQDADNARDNAVQELLQQRGVIDEQLRTLGHEAQPKKKPCSHCGSTEHDARSHRKPKDNA